jgi:AraC-like DNA-binding protein
MPGSFAPSPAFATPLTADGRTGNRPPRRLQVCAALTAAAFVSYILGHMVDGSPGLFMAAIGASACGWSWLLSRALFDSAEREARWALAVMLLVLASGAGAHLVAASGGALSRAVDNAYTLGGSAALLLTFVEPFHGWRRGLPAAEKRFRVSFLVVYGALVGVSIMMLRDATDDPVEAARIAMIKCACAVTGLLAGGAAVWFRARNPLSSPSGATSARTATAEDLRLAEQIDRLMREQEVYATPDLKVADLARRLGQPEYRVTQCITVAMGFPNFNRLINHHRIARARQLLADPDGRRLSIVQVAFESGFSSIGPFNRAFKDEAGTTPRAFRDSRAQH